MFDRRRMLAIGAACAGAVQTGTPLLAQTQDGATADFLFVQTASSVAYDAAGRQLTLRGVSPVTLFFSDRPDRIAGNMTTADFVPFWGQGSDSFLVDPPNADLSVLEDGRLVQTVVTLSAPRLDGQDLHYTADILSGPPPDMGQNVSLFIDVIGMPRTPLSVAGVDRRSFRRAVLY
ncbi:hypothetical protein [Chachezhania sediminis]|uniref:hypothetical protein n=1 Tax=Chachezhania sediminis TaxID=2599291 RepID=UPI0018EF29D9|nr:hypothetical protein [Chachezhania sediminis]